MISNMLSNIIKLFIGIFGLFLAVATKSGKVSFELVREPAPGYGDAGADPLPLPVRIFFAILSAVYILHVIRSWNSYKNQKGTDKPSPPSDDNPLEDEGK